MKPVKKMQDAFTEEGLEVLSQYLKENFGPESIESDLNVLSQEYGEVEWLTLFVDEIHDNSAVSYFDDDTIVVDEIKTVVQTHLEAKDAFVGFTKNNVSVVYRYY